MKYTKYCSIREQERWHEMQKERGKKAAAGKIQYGMKRENGGEAYLHPEIFENPAWAKNPARVQVIGNADGAKQCCGAVTSGQQQFQGMGLAGGASYDQGSPDDYQTTWGDWNPVDVQDVTSNTTRNFATPQRGIGGGLWRRIRHFHANP
jgi:hypothetical protein